MALTLRLAAELHARIKAVAAAQHRSVQGQLVFMLEEWLAGRGKVC